MTWLKGQMVDVRPGEWRLTILMVVYYFFLLFFYYLLKPARDALFLVNLEPDHLPFVYILTALVAAPVTAAYARAGLKYRLGRLIMVTTVILSLQLIIMWWLLSIQQDWVFFLFYSWVAVAAGLTTSQFWLLANTVFDAMEAKRLFPILALGGIAGAFIGGEFTSWLVDSLEIGTRNLLLVALFVLLVAGMISRMVWRYQSRSSGTSAKPADTSDTHERSWSILPIILRSRHLMLTVGIISLTVMTSSFIDFQFKSLSWAAFSDPGDLTSFLGRFYGRMSLLSFLVQVLLATRLIRWLGAGSVLFVLPLILALGTGMMLVVPGLMAAMVLRGGDISLKYSLDKTSRELLFLPIPFALKKRTKVFLDMLVDRWARGLAGVMLLLLTVVLGLGQQSIAWVTALLLVVWLVMVFFMRREYVNSFRKALTRGEIDVRQMRVRIEDSATIGILLGTLNSGQQREINYALDMLKGVSSSRVADGVRPLLGHESSEIRRKVLDLLKNNGSSDDRQSVEGLLQDEDLGVRVAALGVLDEVGSNMGQPGEFLGEMISGPPLCRNAAMAFILENPERLELRPLVNRLVVDQVLADVSVWGDEGRRVLGGASWLPIGCTSLLWDKLLKESEISVVEATVHGVGLRNDQERVGWLLDNLDHPQLRISSRLALVELTRSHEHLIARLEEFFLDRENPLRSRTEIPRILSGVPSEAAVDVLLRRLATHEPELRYIVLKALGRQRAQFPNLNFGPGIVSEEIAVEAGRFIQLDRVGPLLPHEGDAARLLRKAITETQQLRLESVFRLLGLLYPAQDLYNSYHGVMSGRRLPMANARELLNNILTRPHRQLVQALIDEQEVDEAWVDAGVDLGQPMNNTEDVLNFLGISCDPWLASCAIFAGGKAENPAAAPYLEPTGDEMLSLIEKVLILQNVDVFSEVPTDQMAALAGIAREVSFLAGDDIYQENDRPDALYLVLQGKITLHQGPDLVTEVEALAPFGIWALFDDEPRVMTATAAEDSRLLRIGSEEFNDLLADDVRIAKGIIRTVARRLRELAGRVG
jgi:ATP:ADP antiporter, AAA family